MSCIVYGCVNSSIETAGSAITYFSFPKDGGLAAQWSAFTGWPPHEIDVTTAQLCALHFADSAFVPNTNMKALKTDAAPCLYCPVKAEQARAASLASELVEMLVFKSDQKLIELDVQSVNTASETAVSDVKTLQALRARNEQLLEGINSHEQRLKALREALAQKQKEYNEKDLELINFKEELAQIKHSRMSVPEQKMLLGKVFSEAQIKILSGRKKIYWSNDDMAVGYTIRHLSNRQFYTYLTQKLQFPLPAASSIKRWITRKNK